MRRLFVFRAYHLESESRRRLIYLKQNNSIGDAISNINSFGSQSLHKKIEIGNISGVVVASSSMGFTIFDLFNEIINIDDMKLGCSLEVLLHISLTNHNPFELYVSSFLCTEIQFVPNYYKH